MKGASKTENNQENSTSIWELYDVQEVHFGTLILSLQWYFGYKIHITDFFQIIYFKESKNMAVEKNFRVTLNLYKGLRLPVITRKKKHIETGTNNIHTREYGFCCCFWRFSCYFWRFVSHFFFSQCKTLLVFLGLCKSFLALQRRADQANTVCKKQSFFYFKYWQLMWYTKA